MSPKRRIIPVFIPHAGCTHECVFCDQHLITGAKAPVIEYGELQIEKFEVGSQPAELAFYGGSFTAIPVELQNKYLESAQSFLKIDPKNSIRISTRPDCIDSEVVSRLKEYGVATVELGAQSMCDDVLLTSRRGHNVADVDRAAVLVKGAGLKLILQMMTGLPGDTFEKSISTARRFLELEPDGVRIYPTVVIRDTRLHEMWSRGEYREHSIEEAIEICAELVGIFREANIPVIRLGLNPSDTLSGGDAVAGAYHPAFGELVYSRIYFNRAAALLGGVHPGSNVVISVGKGCVSRMIGLNRRNIDTLMQRFSLNSIKVAESTLDPDDLNADGLSVFVG